MAGATVSSELGVERRSRLHFAVASKSDDDKKKTKVAQSIKMKHGVIIQVDVKPQSGP